jgi:hypothetical protein
MVVLLRQFKRNKEHMARQLALLERIASAVEKNSKPAP